MDFVTAFHEINWPSVLVATLAAFIIGALWYSPVLFGNLWQKEIGLSKEDIQGTNMFLLFSLTFILNFIAAIVLELFLGRNATLIEGIIAGSLIGIPWIGTAIATNYLFARRSFKLFLIDAGYFIVFYPVMGLILGSWK